MVEIEMLQTIRKIFVLLCMIFGSYFFFDWYTMKEINLPLLFTLVCLGLLGYECKYLEKKRQSHEDFQ